MAVGLLMAVGSIAGRERGEGAVVRLPTSADEPLGGMFSSCGGEGADGGAGLLPVFDPVDTIEFRLLCTKLAINKIVQGVWEV